ncbi:MAG: SulP family inorganic anion transporter, partial [Dermatophilaceae bacterium]
MDPMYVSVLQGIRPYDRRWLSQDIVAGITLAALAIPEVMGYTKIAGMPVITGLYTILIPIVAFAVFGSSRHLVVGADSATAVIMYAGIAALGVAGLQPASPQWVALAGLSALLTGALLWVARAARLGFLADFLSRTVLVGFLTGVGVQVAIGQVGGMLGIPGQTSELAFFSGDLVKFLKTLGHVGEASWQSTLVSLCVLAVLVVFERWIKAVPGGLVAVVGSIIASWAFTFQSHNISILGPVPSGLPSVGMPSGVTWNDAAGLLPVAVSMLLVILAQSAATSRVYAVRYNEHYEAIPTSLGWAWPTSARASAGHSSSTAARPRPKWSTRPRAAPRSRSSRPLRWSSSCCSSSPNHWSTCQTPCSPRSSSSSASSSLPSRTCTPSIGSARTSS